MAETLHVSEGKIVDSSGNVIVAFSDLSEHARFTEIENRLAAVEAAVAEAPPPEVPDPNAPSPPGGPLKIHVSPEDTPDGSPIPTPSNVSSTGSPLGVDGVAAPRP